MIFFIVLTILAGYGLCGLVTLRYFSDKSLWQYLYFKTKAWLSLSILSFWWAALAFETAGDSFAWIFELLEEKVPIHEIVEVHDEYVEDLLEGKDTEEVEEPIRYVSIKDFFLSREETDTKHIYEILIIVLIVVEIVEGLVTSAILMGK